MPNSIIEQDMNDIKWLNPRLYYLKSFIKPQRQICPECQGPLEPTPDQDELICSSCGLVCSASIEYVAGVRIELPLGRH